MTKQVIVNELWIEAFGRGEIYFKMNFFPVLFYKLALTISVFCLLFNWNWTFWIKPALISDFWTTFCALTRAEDEKRINFFFWVRRVIHLTGERHMHVKNFADMKVTWRKNSCHNMKNRISLHKTKFDKDFSFFRLFWSEASRIS